MPEELRREMESVMRDVQFLDLHDPWFTSAR
jgi:hypothetical protein